MFDRVGYKLLDKGFVKHFKINCMLELTDNMVVFGHQHGVLTLWDTSKRFLTNDELIALQKSMEDQIVGGADVVELAKHNTTP